MFFAEIQIINCKKLFPLFQEKIFCKGFQQDLNQTDSLTIRTNASTTRLLVDAFANVVNYQL